MTHAANTDERPKKAPLVHERSYGWRYPLSFVHRARLRAIIRTMRGCVDESHGSWADFGCSNGFVIEQVMATGQFGFERIVGFDHSLARVEMARAKGIANASFDTFDLNVAQDLGERFGVVSCFETIEHVGDFRLAIRNLYTHLADGGLLILTFPVETGMRGLVKLALRSVVCPSANHTFFEYASRTAYLRALVQNDYIDGFRDPAIEDYGPHLGFDHRRVVEFMDEAFVETGELTALGSWGSFGGMNRILVYRRNG